MREKIIISFSMLVFIILGSMMYLAAKQEIKNDIVPIIFMIIFCILLVAFIVTMIIMRLKKWR